jgi:hypothetical protein
MKKEYLFLIQFKLIFSTRSVTLQIICKTFDYILKENGIKV